MQHLFFGVDEPLPLHNTLWVNQTCERADTNAKAIVDYLIYRTHWRFKLQPFDYRLALLRAVA
jgi:hypothetical protein